MRRALVIGLVAACASARLTARAQTPMAHDFMLTAGINAIPLLTWANRTAGDRALVEAYVTQPMVMGALSYHSLSALGTLDLEGLSLQRGELTTGAWGEGYVDRRHPHTYVHEAMLGGFVDVGPSSASLYAGRGFAPFGSDDPMVRPFVKYPVNHHLAQILERVVAIGAVSLRSLVAEAGTFNGDEPTSPSSAPQWKRFGDSWSARLTWTPDDVVELTYSHAAVKSPESPLGGTFDHRKNHASIRLTPRRGVVTYAFAEWAQTDEVLRGTRAFRYDSYLAETSAAVGAMVASVRLERSSRPEEQRREDLFRSVRPTTDLSILGVSEWTTLTANVSGAPLALASLHAMPFVEASVEQVAAGRPVGVVNLSTLYGSRGLWLLSLGARVRVGHVHDRMGRYGVANRVSALRAPAM